MRRAVVFWAVTLSLCAGAALTPLARMQPTGSSADARLRALTSVRGADVDAGPDVTGFHPDCPAPPVCAASWPDRVPSHATASVTAKDGATGERNGGSGGAILNGSIKSHGQITIHSGHGGDATADLATGKAGSGLTFNGTDAYVEMTNTTFSLANAMSVALENARLFDETQRLLKESAQRAQELAIINSVQEGLASKLDMQAIYDLVGNKIRDIFQTEVVYIAIRNAGNLNQIDFPYYVDRGILLKATPLTMGEGLTSKVILDRQPLLLNTMEEQIRHGAVFESDERANTYLGIPIIIGDFVAGVVSVQSYKEHAFSESDVRLLETLSNAMSIALENARLFDETQRLL